MCTSCAGTASAGLLRGIGVLIVELGLFIVDNRA